jgi:hypothetical protein
MRLLEFFGSTQSRSTVGSCFGISIAAKRHAVALAAFKLVPLGEASGGATLEVS